MSIHQCLPALEVDQHSRVHNISVQSLFSLIHVIASYVVLLLQISFSHAKAIKGQQQKTPSQFLPAVVFYLESHFLYASAPLLPSYNSQAQKTDTINHGKWLGSFTIFLYPFKVGCVFVDSSSSSKRLNQNDSAEKTKKEGLWSLMKLERFSKSFQFTLWHSTKSCLCLLKGQSESSRLQTTKAYYYYFVVSAFSGGPSTSSSCLGLLL